MPHVVHRSVAERPRNATNCLASNLSPNNQLLIAKCVLHTLLAALALVIYSYLCH